MPVPPVLPVGPWVCTEGHDVKASDVQRGIDNRPVGLCRVCRRASADPEVQVRRETVRRFASRLVPVVLKADYVPKAAKPVEAKPEPMFADAEVPRGFLDGEGRVVAEHMTERRGRAGR